MTDSNDAEQEFIEAFEFALDLYQKGHFSEAQVRFQKLE